MKLYTVRNGVAIEAPPKQCYTCKKDLFAHEKYFRRMFKTNGKNNGFSRDCLECEQADILKHRAEQIEECAIALWQESKRIWHKGAAGKSRWSSLSESTREIFRDRARRSRHVTL